MELWSRLPAKHADASKPDTSSPAAHHDATQTHSFESGFCLPGVGALAMCRCNACTEHGANLQRMALHAAGCWPV